jgi:hypothetical protein
MAADVLHVNGYYALVIGLYREGGLRCRFGDMDVSLTGVTAMFGTRGDDATGPRWAGADGVGTVPVAVGVMHDGWHGHHAAVGAASVGGTREPPSGLDGIATDLSLAGPSVLSCGALSSR